MRSITDVLRDKESQLKTLETHVEQLRAAVRILGEEEPRSHELEPQLVGAEVSHTNGNGNGNKRWP
jgi:uncharacterized protein involved in exopolysaccharide biosynthesis